MRKRNHPKWSDWGAIVNGLLESAVSNAELVGYRLNSAPTIKNIRIEDPDRMIGSMPFVSSGLVNWERGWDSANSGQSDYNTKNYTSLGGDKMLESTVSIKERLTFSVEVFTQKYKDTIEILDVIHAFFGPAKTLSFQWNNSTYDIDIKLDNYNLNIVEGNKEGKIEFFHGSYSLTIYVTSDSLDDDTVNKAITSVILSVIAELNEQESSELQKTQE